MHEYPSTIRIDSKGIDQEFYTWDKIDGQQIRAFYSRKTGFYKFGSRRSLFDKTDLVFGKAIPLFMETMSEPLLKAMHDQHWVSGIAYMEYYGDNSLAGRHKQDEPKKLKLFDVARDKNLGILPPKEFLKLFGDLNTPNFLGVKKWDKVFVDDVKSSKFDEISFEGVVGKSGSWNALTLVKCKTDKWLDAIRQLYSEEEARRIIES